MKNEYSLQNIKKIKWGVLEENNPISLYPVMYPGWCHIIEKMGKILGKYQKSIICIHEGKKGVIFVDHKEWNDLGVFTLNKMISNPGFAEKLDKKILNLSDKLVLFATKKVFNSDLSKRANKELALLYKRYEDLHGDLYSYSIIPVYLELYKPNLTKYLIKYLENQIVKNNYKKSAKECFAILTTVDKSSKIQLEEISLLKIGIEINKNNAARELFNKNNINAISAGLNGLAGGLSKKIKGHMLKYRYLGYNFEGPAFPDSYFLGRWQEMIKRKENLKGALAKINKNKIESKKLIKKLNRELKIDKKHLRLFSIARDIIYGKDYRKMSLVEAYYKIEPLLKEISKRLRLSLDQARNCLLKEIELMLSGKNFKPENLDKRMRGCLFIVVNGKLPGRVYTDKLFKEMKNYLKKKEDLSEIMYFHGQTASTGKATGIVKIINAIKDLPKMKEGDVLVSQMTNPDLVPAMKKASAIITDLGGITCHAAIVSRELKIPCVIGTKIATKSLKDGDKVFVDANQGEVRVLERKN